MLPCPARRSCQGQGRRTAPRPPPRMVQRARGGPASASCSRRCRAARGRGRSHCLAVVWQRCPCLRTAGRDVPMCGDERPVAQCVPHSSENLQIGTSSRSAAMSNTTLWNCRSSRLKWAPGSTTASSSSRMPDSSSECSCSEAGPGLLPRRRHIWAAALQLSAQRDLAGNKRAGLAIRRTASLKHGPANARRERRRDGGASAAIR